MKSRNHLKIALLPGDGIGPEVLNAAVPIFDILNLPITLQYGAIGWQCWKREGNPIPPATWKLIQETDAALLGAITSKPLREAIKELSPSLQKEPPAYVSPLIQLRQQLNLYANVRPCFALSGAPFDFCIVRENSEGLYAGFDFHPLPAAWRKVIQHDPRWANLDAQELSGTLRLQTAPNLRRIYEFAFKYAEQKNIQRVTLADKPNVLRVSSHFAREIFEKTAASYPHIQADIVNVDALALWLIRRPQQFGVIVAENMFGDILSDVGAGVMGGLGFAPSANIGAHYCYFEPVHGSAPLLAPNRANPSAMFLSISLLLEHFNFTHQAATIRDAVTHVVQRKENVTYDLGGKASTEEMAHQIIDTYTRLTRTSTAPHKYGLTAMQKSELALLCTSELSDALDACGIEGALLDVKPVQHGIKMFGPAFTVEFIHDECIGKEFRNAANYIDEVPKDSILVIDNKGNIECTAWGAILTRAALQHGLAGTLLNGATRDSAFIREANYPVFSKAIYMRSGKNRIRLGAIQQPVCINTITINPGDIIFGDDDGVLVLPARLLDELIAKAKNIKRTENSIAQALDQGVSLKKARADYRYDQPWIGTLNNQEDD
ncbi:MAG: isocitrate/isopropylmalate dehydrogenase family protein [Legionella sp.]|nr:isocitrate/isopropylmalate dehydrogenase family protein [Legionella sp.]